MIFDRNDKTTWPEEHKYVQVWSPKWGFSHAEFFLQNHNSINGGVGFGNCQCQGESIYGEDSQPDMTGTIEWWPVPEVEWRPLHVVEAG